MARMRSATKAAVRGLAITKPKKKSGRKESKTAATGFPRDRNGIFPADPKPARPHQHRLPRYPTPWRGGLGRFICQRGRSGRRETFAYRRRGRAAEHLKAHTLQVECRRQRAGAYEAGRGTTISGGSDKGLCRSADPHIQQDAMDAAMMKVDGASSFRPPKGSKRGQNEAKRGESGRA